MIRLLTTFIASLRERRSRRLNLAAYGVTTDLVASLATHPGFQFLCACIEDRKARLERERDKSQSPPTGLDDMIVSTVASAVRDSRITELGWLARQITNAGVKMAEFEATQ